MRLWAFLFFFSTYVVFPLIYLLNILQFVLVVDTAADADFCDKSTIFVYINFLRCPIPFSFISFLFIFSLKHNNQSVLMVDITAGAEFCHGDTIFFHSSTCDEDIIVFLSHFSEI